MPKGQAGCYVCGEPSERVVQVTLYDYDFGRETYARGDPRDTRGRCRPAGTVDSVQRSYCATCATEVYAEVTPILARHTAKIRGCGVCGASPTVSRVQLWMRTRGPGQKQTHLQAVSLGLCDEHRLPVYLQAIEPLDGDDVNPGPPTHRDGFASARAALKRRR